jgi:hypothetical protein
MFPAIALLALFTLGVSDASSHDASRAAEIAGMLSLGLSAARYRGIEGASYVLSDMQATRIGCHVDRMTGEVLQTVEDFAIALGLGSKCWLDREYCRYEIPADVVDIYRQLNIDFVKYIDSVHPEGTRENKDLLFYAGELIDRCRNYRMMRGDYQ